MFIKFFKKFLNAILFPNTRDNEHFCKYLKSKGVIIGEGTRFIDPKKCHIDPGRMDYISIGANCCLSVVSIIAHDYSWYVFADSHNDILPDSGGEVKIGNNVFIGYQSCILKGTTIGDNVIIGARSVVKGNIPSNTVWGGVPARQICTLDDLYERKSKQRINDAYTRRDHIKRQYNRNPIIEEMGFFSFLFLERHEQNFNYYLSGLEFNGIKNSKIIKELFYCSKPCFKSFEDFLHSNIE